MKTELVYSYLIYTRGFSHKFKLDMLEFQFDRKCRNFFGVHLDEGGFIIKDDKHPNKVSEFLSLYFGYTDKVKEEEKELMI